MLKITNAEVTIAEVRRNLFTLFIKSPIERVNHFRLLDAVPLQSRIRSRKRQKHSLVIDPHIFMISGGPAESRTLDPQLAKLVLYQLSYWPAPIIFMNTTLVQNGGPERESHPLFKLFPLISVYNNRLNNL